MYFFSLINQKFDRHEASEFSNHLMRCHYEELLWYYSVVWYEMYRPVLITTWLDLLVPGWVCQASKMTRKLTSTRLRVTYRAGLVQSDLITKLNASSTKHRWSPYGCISPSNDLLTTARRYFGPRFPYSPLWWMCPYTQHSVKCECLSSSLTKKSACFLPTVSWICRC